MASAYLVLAAIAALGLALGWRLTPTPSERTEADGLARLLQLGIALTGLLVLVLLLVPWFTRLDAIACTPESERVGECILGFQEGGILGASTFCCLVGAAFAFVLRKGVLDFPPAAPIDDDQREAGVGDMDRVKVRELPIANDEPTGDDQPTGDDESTGDDQPTEDDQPAGHRRLEGPVFRAFVDDEATDLELAISTAVERLRSERVAVVFSRGASKAANVALLELAEAFDAYRYVLEGTAAATEGVPTGEEPDPNAADEVAGPKARHAGELALDLAGAFIQTVFLLDTRVAFPEFVLGKLTEMQSVCIAHAHDDVSAACQVLLPGTNPGEREGELIDSGGGTNSRRPRATLVAQIVTALRALELDQPSPAEPNEDPS